MVSETGRYRFDYGISTITQPYQRFLTVGSPSQFEAEAYKSMVEDDDVLLIAAAGNGGNSAFSYPASYTSVMSVAAVQSNEQRIYFSQYNEQVDIAAPGVSTLSTIPNNRYGSKSGTSSKFRS